MLPDALVWEAPPLRRAQRLGDNPVGWLQCSCIVLNMHPISDQPKVSELSHTQSALQRESRLLIM